MEYHVISTDSHVNEPKNVWQERLPPHLREQGPKLVECEDGGQGWTFEGNKPTSYGLGAVSQTGGTDFSKYKQRGVRFEDLPKGNWDPAEHLKDQDRDGVDASVIYAGAGISCYKIKDKELRLASFRAYNDWLIDDFAGKNPQRILPLALVPADDDIEVAVSELQRCIEKGARGGVVPTYPFHKSFADPYYEPLWAAAAESGFPLHFHRGTGRQAPSSTGTLPSGAASVANIVLRFFAAMEPISYMTFSGVLHRHPKLKLVSAESDFGWWPFFSQLCDDQWERQRHWSESPMTEKPSSYFKNQLYLTFMDDEVGCANLKFIGTDNFMFASDYPHSVTTWPNSRKYIEKQMKAAGVSAEVQHKLVAGNAERLYRLNAA